MLEAQAKHVVWAGGDLVFVPCLLVAVKEH